MAGRPDAGAGSTGDARSPAPDPGGSGVGGWLRRRRARRRHHALASSVLLLVLIVVAASAAGLAVLLDSPEAVVGCRLDETPPRVTGGNTVLTAADGSVLGFVPTGQNREVVPMDRMSPWLPSATIAIEDRRFWHHGALDPLGVGRSALEDLVSGRVVQGASTITQQLVRSRYLTGEKPGLRRKLKEACLAVQLFRRWPRRVILEAYLNTVFYGHHARGVEAASWTYFSRSSRHLSLTQAALLAGLPQAPSRYDPLRDPTAARARRNDVLAAMRRAGVITAARARSARAQPLGLRPGDRYMSTRFATFFGAARDAIVARLGRPLVRHGALRVRTTVVPRLERAADRAIGGWIDAPGDPAAALVAIDPRTGAVLAAASRAPGRRALRFNLATQSRRQAGSAFKVFTLATAIEQGIPLGSRWSGPPSLTVDDPRCLNGAAPWVVHNFADETAGRMTLADAIAHSVNTIFAQVAVRVGPREIVRMAHRLGVRSPLKPVCSITLGPEGVSPLEMTDAFATLAAGGVRRAPLLVRRVVTRRADALWPRPPHGRRVVSRGVVAKVTTALTGVVRAGTGVAADPGRPAAGKTGTAENFVDAWFCGYVPQLAACVWIGHPEAETPIAGFDGFAQIVGGSVPARIWHDFMVSALAGRRVLPLPHVAYRTLPDRTRRARRPAAVAPSAGGMRAPATTAPAPSPSPAAPPATGDGGTPASPSPSPSTSPAPSPDVTIDPSSGGTGAAPGNRR